MYCPNCDNILISVERNKIELEHCTECGGFWLDIDEWFLIKETLQLSSDADDIAKLPPLSLKEAGEKARLCPVCTRRMEKIKVGTIILDRCVNYHGVWFDKNELSLYMNKNADIKESKLVEFLGENFIK